MTKEFSGVRSSLYKEALKEYSQARQEDIEVMKKYLAPMGGEKILEIEGKLLDEVFHLLRGNPRFTRLKFADQITLGRAIEGRKQLSG